jgi:hypothetical protein
MPMSGALVRPILETHRNDFTRELQMYTDPDAYRLIAKQRQSELIAEASRERLARSVARSRRGRSPDRSSDTQ